MGVEEKEIENGDNFIDLISNRIISYYNDNFYTALSIIANGLKRSSDLFKKSIMDYQSKFRSVLYNYGCFLLYANKGGNIIDLTRYRRSNNWRKLHNQPLRRKQKFISVREMEDIYNRALSHEMRNTIDFQLFYRAHYAMLKDKIEEPERRYLINGINSK